MTMATTKTAKEEIEEVLGEGETTEFEVGEGKKGPKAQNVKKSA